MYNSNGKWYKNYIDILAIFWSHLTYMRKYVRNVPKPSPFLSSTDSSMNLESIFS